MWTETFLHNWIIKNIAFMMRYQYLLAHVFYEPYNCFYILFQSWFLLNLVRWRNIYNIYHQTFSTLLILLVSHFICWKHVQLDTVSLKSLRIYFQQDTCLIFSRYQFAYEILFWHVRREYVAYYILLPNKFIHLLRNSKKFVNA